MIMVTWVCLLAVHNVLAPHFEKHSTFGVLVIPDMLFYALIFTGGLYAYKEMRASQGILPDWALGALLAGIVVLWMLSYDKEKFILLSFAFATVLPYIRMIRYPKLNRATAWIAKYSYGIYLLHDPAIWMAFVKGNHLPLAARICAFLAIVFGGSVLLYHAIEHPMILVGNKLASRIPARLNRIEPESVEVSI
jgi:peptidoglycan/LPS O-acetylase OafA/YrhL